MIYLFFVIRLVQEKLKALLSSLLALCISFYYLSLHPSIRLSRLLILGCFNKKSGLISPCFPGY